MPKAALLLVLFAGACQPYVPATSPERALVELAPADFPAFADDLSYAKLDQAIGHSLDALGRLAASDPGRTYRFGPVRVPLAKVVDSLEQFRALIASRPDAKTLRAALQAGFRVFQSTGADRERHVLFTGYYLPELDASATKDPTHPWPLYGPPPDLVVARAKDFPQLTSDLVGRVVGGRLEPYPTRADIARGEVPSAAAVAWVSSAVDAFFLEIQGSGLLRYPGGATKVASFAGKNGRRYVAIGAELIRRGEVSRDAMSMQAIRAWLAAHPDQREALLDTNPSYVFFRLGADATGSLGVPVTGGRTLATDFRVFPKGALSFIETARPDGAGRTTPLTRFMLDQDTGGAIRTAAHVDVFLGAGPEAAEVAGRMKQQGKLYYLLAK